MTEHGSLVFARCVGFVFRAPGFSHPSVPPALRAGLAVVLALGLSHADAARPSLAPLTLVVALAVELALGGAIGVGASVLYDGAYAAGRALDDYVGVRGSVPNAAVYSAAGFGRIWSLVFTAGFFLLGGYRYVIAVFAQTFKRLPAGMTVSNGPLWSFALALPALILKAAVLIAGPAFALVFFAQCMIGALGRVIPRFAGFTLSFPVIFCAALCMTIVMVPLLLPLSGKAWMLMP